MSIQTIKDQLRQIRERTDYPSLGIKIDLRASRESLKSQLAEAQTRIAEQEKEQEVDKDAEKLSEVVQSLIEERREAVDDFLRSDNENLRVINRGEIPCLWTGWDDLEGTPTASFRSRWERMCIALSRELAYIASKAFPELGIPTGVDSPFLEFRHHAGEGGLPVRECLALYELSEDLVSSPQVEEKNAPERQYLINAPSVRLALEHFYRDEFHYNAVLNATLSRPVLMESLGWLGGEENSFTPCSDGEYWIQLAYFPTITFDAQLKSGTLEFTAYIGGDEVDAPPPIQEAFEGDFSDSDIEHLVREQAHQAYWVWLYSLLDDNPEGDLGLDYYIAAIILDYHDKDVPDDVRDAILSGEWVSSAESCGRERGFMEYQIVQTTLKSYKDDIEDYLDGPRPKAELWHKHLPNMRGNTFKDTDHPALKWEKLNLRLSKELTRNSTAVYGSTTPAEQDAVFSFAYDPDIKQHQLPLLECLALNTLLARKNIFGD